MPGVFFLESQSSSALSMNMGLPIPQDASFDVTDLVFAFSQKSEFKISRSSGCMAAITPNIAILAPNVVKHREEDKDLVWNSLLSFAAPKKSNAEKELPSRSVVPNSTSSTPTSFDQSKVKEKELSKIVHSVSDPWKPLKLLLSGAASAVASRTLLAPLERLKMELVLRKGPGDTLAVATQIYTMEGVGGFWKGNWLNILRTAPFKALNFLSFDVYHHTLVRMTNKDGNFERFAAGACAGVTATLVCFPLDVLRTRVMAGAVLKHGGPLATLAAIAKLEGLGSLYTGCLPAVIGMAPAGAVFYGVYDLLKSRHLKVVAETRAHMQETPGASQKPLVLDALHMLMFGAIAGLASEVVVYPLEVVRRRMQLSVMAAAAVTGIRASTRLGKVVGAVGNPANHGMAGSWQRAVAAFEKIAVTEGAKGFYAGMLPNMLQVLFSSAVSYYTYDTLKVALGVMD